MRQVCVNNMRIIRRYHLVRELFEEVDDRLEATEQGNDNDDVRK